jgi:hypothetical protein
MNKIIIYFINAAYWVWLGSFIEVGGSVVNVL